jgi:cytidylate kinase
MGENQIDVIAIDGPAGSGKSTTARLVAQKLGFVYLDTGALYRALTHKVLTRNIDVHDQSEILALIKNTKIELRIQKGRIKLFLDGNDITRKIRTQKVSRNVSTIAAYQGVREWMVKMQRKIGERGKIVAEGRDIGTVVFPRARLKFFLIASLEERARRRQKDFSREKKPVHLHKVADELKKRDINDSSREIGPLRQADDAIVLDTSNLTIEQQVEFVVEQWNKKVGSEL